MISFKWSTSSSVLDSLTVVGRLVRVEDTCLVVDVEEFVRNEVQKQALQALEIHHKLNREAEDRLICVLRAEIAEVHPYSDLTAH
jgi:hypothetical protein